MTEENSEWVSEYPPEDSGDTEAELQSKWHSQVSLRKARSAPSPCPLLSKPAGAASTHSLPGISPQPSVNIEGGKKKQSLQGPGRRLIE